MGRLMGHFLRYEEFLNESLTPAQLKQKLSEAKYKTGEKVYIKKGTDARRKKGSESKFTKHYMSSPETVEIDRINHYLTKVSGKIYYETKNPDATYVVSEDDLMTIGARSSMAEKATVLIEAFMRKTGTEVEIAGSTKTKDGDLIELTLRFHYYTVVAGKRILDSFFEDEIRDYFSKKTAETVAQKFEEITKEYEKEEPHVHFRKKFTVKKETSTYQLEEFFKYLEESLDIDTSDDSVEKMKVEFRGSSVGKNLGIV